MADLFFVYGTLMSGHSNNRLLSTSQSLGGAISEDSYDLRHLGFPGAIKNDEGLKIKGELFSVDDDSVVASLDRLEGNGSFYTRSKRRFIGEEGESVEAWVYELPSGRYEDAPMCRVDEDTAYYWNGRLG